MKGMLNFLERAGLVRQDSAVAPAAPATMHSASAGAEPVAPTATTVAAPGAPLNLDDIYATQGIAPSIYPAERLLRLVDGLSAMDAGTRLMAIKAMDAADESWSIEDPLADATAKLAALAVHAEQLRLDLQVQERETQSQLAAVAARQQQVVGDIRKQISELEALVTRELARAAQETAELEAHFSATRDPVSSDLAEINRADQRLRSLSAQFGSSASMPQG